MTLPGPTEIYSVLNTAVLVGQVVSKCADNRTSRQIQKTKTRVNKVAFAEAAKLAAKGKLSYEQTVEFMCEQCK